VALAAERFLPLFKMMMVGILAKPDKLAGWRGVPAQRHVVAIAAREHRIDFKN
jgi:hypothetical protein